MSIEDQISIKSDFHAKSTASDVLAETDLAGKIAIVTGGYSGIGIETVRALAGKGVKVIVPARSYQKATDALSDVVGDVSTVPMDLADISSVRQFAATMLDDLPGLDLLINNAGVMASPESRVGPGWESQFGICHMGHFILALGLFPLLERTSGARCVALSSVAHKVSNVQWDDIQFKTNPYNKWVAYGQAKTANALFANALSRRLKKTEGLAFSVHPGGILTPLQRHLQKEEMMALGWIDESGAPTEMVMASFKTPEQGASTTLWAATSPQLLGMPGVYCEDCDVAIPTDPNSPTATYGGVDPHACDDESAERLWEVSMQLLDPT